jgi:hypothetical protein
MTKRAGAALLLITAALFLIANRSAYKGYFQDDELNNISWTRKLPLSDYAGGLLTPLFFTYNFRPVGHLYFRQMSLWYGLQFGNYLPVMHVAHILNVWLVWLLARRLGLAPLAASLGTLLFAFHMAVFDVYWKPMYVFDLLCATFILASILLYVQRRYVLSFCAFWLAYKSKEMAVTLPLALACYEFWLAEKKSWKPLIPFFAVSISFGLQGILRNPNVDNDYAFRFTPGAFWTSLSYYSSRILFIPYAGLALLALPFAVRDRRLWFGCAILCLFFVPLMFLPGRLYPAYCYIPLTGLALMAAVLASRKNLTPVMALLCAASLIWNVRQLRKYQRETLAIDAQNRTYVAALSNFARVSKDTQIFVYDETPAGLHPWGIEGALQFLYDRAIQMYSIGDKEAAEALRKEDVALLKWNPVDRKLAVITGRKQAPYFAMNRQTPVWQLGGGWYVQAEGYRWMAPEASATLAQPEEALHFDLVVNLPPDQIAQTGPISVSLALNGADIGKRRLTASGVQTLSWPSPQSASEEASVNIRVTPEFKPSNGDSRRLGLAVLALGFR